ncbi:MAG TPA: DUF4342 domain-containing protein [Caldilineaceae bacterium]|nr:DUF4342 domain-containing protein [Caldilineaceae bacterium]
MSEKTPRVEEFKVQGEKIVGKVKELIRAGNVRRLIVKNRDGKPLIDIPLTVGVIGAVLAPQLAVLGAIVALLVDGSLVVEKTSEVTDEMMDESAEAMFEI